MSILGEFGQIRSAPEHASATSFIPDPAAAGGRDKEGHYGMGERSEASGLCSSGMCWCCRQ